MNDLAVITTYFNHFGNNRIHHNYFRFAKQIHDLGINLLTIEVAHNDNKYQIPGSIGYRTSSVLWHKENLINLGVSKHIPNKYKYIAWVDADIEFVGIEAFEEAREKLEEFVVVQLFNKSIRLDQQGLPNEIACSYPYWLKAKETQKSLPRCVPGFAWAASREFLLDHPLYEATMLGGSDSVFATSIYGWFEDAIYNHFTPAMLEHYKPWGHAIHNSVQGRVGYVNHPIKHWWHGDEVGRDYAVRNFLYRLYDFQPERDLCHNQDGLLEFTQAGFLMGQAVNRYLCLQAGKK